MPTTAQIRSILTAIQAGPLKSANITGSYQGDTFTATRGTLASEESVSLYGSTQEYQFSIYLDKSQLTTEVKTDQKITITGAYGTTGSSPMRVMGSSIDPVSALVRLDLKEDV